MKRRLQTLRRDSRAAERCSARLHPGRSAFYEQQRSGRYWAARREIFGETADFDAASNYPYLYADSVLAGGLAELQRPCVASCISGDTSSRRRHPTPSGWLGLRRSSKQNRPYPNKHPSTSVRAGATGAHRRRRLAFQRGQERPSLGPRYGGIHLTTGPWLLLANALTRDLPLTNTLSDDLEKPGCLTYL